MWAILQFKKCQTWNQQGPSPVLPDRRLHIMADPDVVGAKRRVSRFAEVEPEPKRVAIDVSAAAARAAELSRELSSKIAMVSSLLGSTGTAAPVKSDAQERKPAFRPLMLDAQGREIDEYGNIVKTSADKVKTLAANVAAERANKKKENPYLAHRSSASAPLAMSAVVASDNGAVAGSAAVLPEAAVDDRLQVAKRDLRGRKGLHFIEAGALVSEAERIKLKEERKIIAGYSSGRKALQHPTSTVEQKEQEQSIASNDVSGVRSGTRDSVTEVPPYPDSAVPALEWWDEAFLPKERRDARRTSKAAHLQSESGISLLALPNARTHKLVQHPMPVRPLGVSALGEKPAVVLPMYLTKQERKKLRRTTRQEREMEKRDKMMMGLIPAPEPKLKLSNFMKVLGDQAVADPSLVEARVLQQMQKRVLNHEMRNQAAKLTPQERREKKQRKRQEDTSRGVHVAVFRVKDFANLKHRFKVDVNAQQYYLSGIVLLCTEPNSTSNLVVAEGGPKGVRKFVRLMTERINWTESWVPTASRSRKYGGEGTGEGGEGEGEGWNYAEEGEGEGEEGDGDPDSSSDEEGGGDKQRDDKQDAKHGGSEGDGSMQARSFADNRCDLLWQGLLPKRVFTGFKFQESATTAAARKVLKAKGVGHYWDMVEQADSAIAAAAPLSLF